MNDNKWLDKSCEDKQYTKRFGRNDFREIAENARDAIKRKANLLLRLDEGEIHDYLALLDELDICRKRTDSLYAELEVATSERDRLRDACEKAYSALLGEAGGGVAVKILHEALSQTKEVDDVLQET